MLASIRRRGHPRRSRPGDQPAPQPGDLPQDPPIPVRLHPTVAIPVSALAAHLGPGFDLQVSESCGESVFVVPEKAFVRHAGEWTGRPQTAVLVLVSADTPSGEIARVLDQGADGCLASSDPPLVASLIVALARRVLHRNPPSP